MPPDLLELGSRFERARLPSHTLAPGTATRTRRKTTQYGKNDRAGEHEGAPPPERPSPGLCGGVQPMTQGGEITQRRGEPSFAHLGRVRKVDTPGFLSCTPSLDARGFQAEPESIRLRSKSGSHSCQCSETPGLSRVSIFKFGSIAAAGGGRAADVEDKCNAGREGGQACNVEDKCAAGRASDVKHKRRARRVGGVEDTRKAAQEG